MDKFSKIFLGIIIILVILSGFLFYKVTYFKKGYEQAANTLYEQTKLLEDSGIEIISKDNNKSEIHIKDINKVVVEK